MKSPAFQFYAADFLADENVELMTNQEVGCFIRLLCYCWREGSIPADVNKIARLCREDSVAMAQLWLAISPCFDSHPSDPTRLINPRLEQERKSQEERRSERAESGRRGAVSRWNKDKNGTGADEGGTCGDGTANSLANGTAMQQPLANDGPSSSSSTTGNNTTTPQTRACDPRDDEQLESSLPDIPEYPERISDFSNFMQRRGISHGQSLSATAIALYQDWMKRKLPLSLIRQGCISAEAKAREKGKTISSPAFYRSFVDELEHALKHPHESQHTTNSKENGNGQHGARRYSPNEAVRIARERRRQPGNLIDGDAT